MSCLITYRDHSNNLRDMEWIVPVGWSDAAIQRSFAEQYPNATFVSIIRG